MHGMCDTGSDVMSLDLARTKEMCWAVTEFNACAGIEITESHNLINYSGMKIVKSGSQPLDDQQDFQAISRKSTLDREPIKRLHPKYLKRSAQEIRTVRP